MNTKQIGCKSFFDDLFHSFECDSIEDNVVKSECIGRKERSNVLYV